MFNCVCKPVLEAAGVQMDVVETRRPGHAIEIAQSVVPGSYDALICVGGDGTVFEVLQVGSWDELLTPWIGSDKSMLTLFNEIAATIHCRYAFRTIAKCISSISIAPLHQSWQLRSAAASA